MAVQYHPFPDRILSDTKKDGEYTLCMAKAIWYNYDAGNNYICGSLKSIFAENRKYGEGNQSPEKYKAQFSLEKDNATGKRKGLDNINYDIVPVAPKIRNSVIALLSDRSNRTNVVFLNDIASEEKKDKKYMMQAEIENAEMLKQIDQVRGLPTREDPLKPKTVEDLNILEATGGIKLETEVALEKGIDYILNYEAKWDDKISSEVKGNLVDNGFAVVVDYIDPVTEEIKVRIPNIEKVVLDGSASLFYDDAQYFGEIREMTVLDVYHQVYNTTGKKITERDLRSLGLSGRSLDNNTTLNSTFYSAPMDKELYGFLPERVQILDFMYLSTDIIKSPRVDAEKHYIAKSKVKKSEINSGKIKEDEKGYYKLINKNNKELKVDVWRRGKWIIGTEIIYDFGLCYNQVRDNNFSPLKPFHAVRTHGKSIIRTIIPNLDALQLDFLKIQNLKNEMSGYGVAIDFQALANIRMGGKDYSAKKLIKLYKLTNTLLYKGKDSNPMGGAVGSPITELEGGMGRAYNELMQDVQWNLSQIRDNIGLNDVALSANPNPEVTLGQSQLAMTSATNSIRHIYVAYKYLKESIAYNIAVRLHDEAKKKGKKSRYSGIIGNEFMALSKTENDYIRKEGIKIIDNPSLEEINILKQNLAKMSYNGIITVYDEFLITSMIQEGKPLKYIASVMEQKMKQRKEEEMQAQRQMMEENSRKQMEMQEAKLNFEASKEGFKSQAKIKEINTEYDRKERLDEQNDLREAELFNEPYRNNT